MTVAALLSVLEQMPPQAEVLVSIDCHFGDDVCVELRADDGVQLVFVTAISDALAEPQWKILTGEEA